MKFHSLELLRRAQQVPLRERILQFAISVAAGTLVVGGLMMLIPLGE